MSTQKRAIPLARRHCIKGAPLMRNRLLICIFCIGITLLLVE